MTVIMRKEKKINFDIHHTIPKFYKIFNDGYESQNNSKGINYKIN